MTTQELIDQLKSICKNCDGYKHWDQYGCLGWCKERLTPREILERLGEIIDMKNPMKHLLEM